MSCCKHVHAITQSLLGLRQAGCLRHSPHVAAFKSYRPAIAEPVTVVQRCTKSGIGSDCSTPLRMAAYRLGCDSPHWPMVCTSTVGHTLTCLHHKDEPELKQFWLLGGRAPRAQTATVPVTES